MPVGEGAAAVRRARLGQQRSRVSDQSAFEGDQRPYPQPGRDPARRPNPPAEPLDPAAGALRGHPVAGDQVDQRPDHERAELECWYAGPLGLLQVEPEPPAGDVELAQAERDHAKMPVDLANEHGEPGALGDREAGLTLFSGDQRATAMEREVGLGEAGRGQRCGAPDRPARSSRVAASVSTRSVSPALVSSCRRA